MYDSLELLLTILKANSVLLYTGVSEIFQNLNFEHLFIALIWKLPFLKELISVWNESIFHINYRWRDLIQHAQLVFGAMKHNTINL